jgi:hypothetical protein
MQKHPDLSGVTIYRPYSIPRVIRTLGWNVCVGGSDCGNLSTAQYYFVCVERRIFLKVIHAKS